MSEKANIQRFTADEIMFLREHSAEYSATELAQKLGRPYVSVSQKLRELNLPRKLGAQGRHGVSWQGCDKTCPDFCPYPDCRMPTDKAAVGIDEDFILKELFDWHRKQ